MYIPQINLETDREKIIAFMQRFSFAAIITAKQNLPVATHLPFLVTVKDDALILASHFARANEHWKDIETNKSLVIFSEPHAYISPKYYDKELNVPTWNYISVHAYGQGRLITETESVLQVLEATINNYEIAYRQQWDHLPEEYKLKMVKGIVAFGITVTDLQAKKKLSQNKTDTERERIIDAFSKSHDMNEQLIAGYMNDRKRK